MCRTPKLSARLPWAGFLALTLLIACSVPTEHTRDGAEPTIKLSCLDTAESQEAATEDVFDYYFLSAAHAVNASGVVWSGTGDESTLVGLEGDHVACFSGGASGAVIDGGVPNDAMYECTVEHCGGTCPTPCYAYHSAAALGPDVEDLQVIEDLEIRNSGDGISMETESARDVMVRRVYVHDIHDDAFESDFGRGGFTVEESLADRVHTAFAMRLRDSADGDQRDERWTIRRNLVRLHEFPNGYKQRPGHGNVFKLDKSPNEPRFVITDNTVVIGPDTGGSALFPPVSRVEECAENTYLFLGSHEAWDEALNSDGIDDGGDNGERLTALNERFPGCFEIRIRPVSMTEDEFLEVEGWFEAVADWKARNVAGSSG